MIYRWTLGTSVIYKWSVADLKLKWIHTAVEVISCSPICLYLPCLHFCRKSVNKPLKLVINESLSVLTLHISNQQVSFSLRVNPVLERTAFLSRLRVFPHQVDFFPVLHRVFYEISNQLLLQRGVRDGVRRPVNQDYGDDSEKHTEPSSFHLSRPEHCIINRKVLIR